MVPLRVGVLRGGPSHEYDVSLRTGQQVLEALQGERYAARDVFIDRAGAWHLRGLPVEPGRALEQFDVVWNGLHGAYGEDGGVQRVLDTHRMRYTGAGALAAALSLNKPLAKRRLMPSGLAFAAHEVLEQGDWNEEGLRRVFHRLSPPYVVKPALGGSSLGLSLVHSFDELVYAVLGASQLADRVLVEQFVRGREVSVGVIEGFRGEMLYTLPPLEVVPAEQLFGYDEKYGAGHARVLCPAPITRDTKQSLAELARFVHTTLGLADYSLVDFIVARDGIYFLEANALPGLTPTSLIPRALEAVGASVRQFVEHVVARAAGRR